MGWIFWKKSRCCKKKIRLHSQRILQYQTTCAKTATTMLIAQTKFIVMRKEDSMARFYNAARWQCRVTIWRWCWSVFKAKIRIVRWIFSTRGRYIHRHIWRKYHQMNRNTICNCPSFADNFICKHVMTIDYKLGIKEYREEQFLKRDSCEIVPFGNWKSRDMVSKQFRNWFIHSDERLKFLQINLWYAFFLKFASFRLARNTAQKLLSNTNPAFHTKLFHKTLFFDIVFPCPKKCLSMSKML